MATLSERDQRRELGPSLVGVVRFRRRSDKGQFSLDYRSGNVASNANAPSQSAGRPRTHSDRLI